MSINNISLPHPVLGVNDDVFPLLGDDSIVIPQPVMTASHLLFDIKLSQNNRAISEMIRDGKAEYVCELACTDTFLRRCYKSSTPHFHIAIGKTEVRGRINFNCYVAAKYPIQGYSNPDFNDDYFGFTFDLEQGDYLAIFPPAYYNTNIKYDKLYAAGSFMQIVEADEGVKTTKFNLNEDKILIELPHDMFVKYNQVGNGFPNIIHSSIVHNALVYALCNLGEYQDKGKLWADCLIQRFQTEPERKDYDLSDMEDIFSAADQLLRDPYRRLLDALEKISESTNSDQDY